jgi:transposase
MSHLAKPATPLTTPLVVSIGLDLGDRKSQVCELDREGTVVLEALIPTTEAGLTRQFGRLPRCHIVLEAGTHSPWVSRLLTSLGHEVIVANPSAMYGTRQRRGRRRRNDRLDAEFLARQGRADIRLLHPITHRSAEAQAHLELIRARDTVVHTRTDLINHVRGAVKSVGGRLVKCSAEAFPKRAAPELPASVAATLQPLLEVIRTITQQIAAYDRALDALAKTRYPVVARLRAPAGVGVLTALTYVLLVEDPKRFPRSRTVGAYFGLVPQLDASSDSQPQLRISKTGDELGRRLLVSAAQYILGPFGPDCDLRRHGQAIAGRGGKNAKKRAVVAVARKLAVLLHHLWVNDTAYDPDYSRHAAA